MNQMTMSSSLKISIIVLGYNNKDLTLDCLGSVMASDYPIHEIIYVDNGSTDGAVEVVKEKYQNIKVIKLYNNFFYAMAMNFGLISATGDIVFCLCNDTVIHSSCIKEICLGMKDETIGCATPKLLRNGSNNLDMSICRLGFIGIFPYSIDYGKEDKGQCDNLIPDYVSGCAMVLRRSILPRIGIFDPWFPIFWQDVNLSLRIKKQGYKLGFIPKAIVWHRGGQTVKKMNRQTKWDINSGRIKMLLYYMLGVYKCTD